MQLPPTIVERVRANPPVKGELGAAFRLLGVAVVATFVIDGRSHARIRAAAQQPPESTGSAVVSYTSETALDGPSQRHPARVVRRIPALRSSRFGPPADARAICARARPRAGHHARRANGEPALAAEPSLAALPRRRFPVAVRGDPRRPVPGAVTHAAAGITIAVIDTGADLAAPDLAAKAPLSLQRPARERTAVTDPNGHGTFVASLAAGSSSNGDGIAGISGDAR